MTTETIIIDSRRACWRLVIFCVAIEVALLVLDATINYGRLTELGMIRRLFNATREDGLASWFGVTQVFMVALTLWSIYALAKFRGAPQRTVFGWMLLALFFTYLAVDDGSMIHERMGSAFEKIQETRQENGEGSILEVFPSYAWQVVFMPVFATIGVLMMRFLWRELDAASLRWAVFFALGVLAFAVVLDFFEGLDPSHPFNVYAWVQRNTDLGTVTREWFGRSAYKTLRHFSKSIEEVLEMLAMTVLWAVFLLHFTHMAGELRIRFINSLGSKV